MRSNRLGSQHQEAVSRRLDLLSAELAAVREGEGPPTRPRGQAIDPRPWAAPPTHTRVRPDRLEAPAQEDDVGSDPGLAEVRLPGRHARRRGVAGPGALGVLRERVVIGPGQLAVVALLVVGGLVLTGWWLVRGSASEVAAPHPDGVGSPAPLVTGLADDVVTNSSPSSAGEVSEVVVDVAGRVRRPGIAVLAPGSRVVDALEAAGGARPGVDLAGLNLARALVDGEQILVGVDPAPGLAAGAVGTAAPPTIGTALVPLNTADQATLEALPEVGPVTATAIIAWRDQHGGFTSVDELLEVDGIGTATLGQLAPLVTL